MSDITIGGSIYNVSVPLKSKLTTLKQRQQEASAELASQGLSATDAKTQAIIEQLNAQIKVLEKQLSVINQHIRQVMGMKDDSKDEFDKVIVGHAHAYHLRKHGGNLVAVWCNADRFARAEGLHGLFTGMIVSELSEAAQYGIKTSQEELNRENVKLSLRLRTLLIENTPLSEIPKLLLAMDDVHSPLTTFNYKNFSSL